MAAAVEVRDLGWCTVVVEGIYQLGNGIASAQNALGSNPTSKTNNLYNDTMHYSCNGHNDVVALTDANGTTVATYSYGTFGTPTIMESFSNGWHNPFLYDGHDGARYDGETGLYWLSVRAYDPTLGRFISRDPLGRVPLFFDASQPYAYGGNNPINNVDPSGQFFRGAFNGEMAAPRRAAPRPVVARVVPAQPRHAVAAHKQTHVNRVEAMQDRPAPGKPNSAQIGEARRIAGLAAAVFGGIVLVVGLFIALIKFAQELLHRFAAQALVYAGIDFAAGLIPLAAAWAVVAIGLVALAKQLDQAIKVLGVIGLEAGAIGGAFAIESYLPDSAYTESGLGAFDHVMFGIISLFGIAMIGMWVIGILSHIPGLVIRGVINNIIGLNLAILAYKFIGEMQSAIYVQGSSGS